MMCQHCGQKPARIKYCSQRCGRLAFELRYKAQYGISYSQQQTRDKTMLRRLAREASNATQPTTTGGRS